MVAEGIRQAFKGGRQQSSPAIMPMHHISDRHGMKTLQYIVVHTLAITDSSTVWIEGLNRRDAGVVLGT